jgi:hypothetical protein
VINHIDLTGVLRRTVCDLYTDLVTRPTGAAVRDGLEKQLAELGDRSLTVIDFSHVGVIDYSCADEIVAKLLMRYAGLDDNAPPPRDAYFVFRGVKDEHYDAIEAVLERHGLAIVAEVGGGDVILIGIVAEEERMAWDTLCRRGRLTPHELACEVGLAGFDAERVLDRLFRRRLAMRLEQSYVAVGAAQ